MFNKNYWETRQQGNLNKFLVEKYIKIHKIDQCYLRWPRDQIPVFWLAEMQYHTPVWYGFGYHTLCSGAPLNS